LKRAELRQKLAAAIKGDYEIKAELGVGGMAAVYLAEDKRLSRNVAIKVMLPNLVDVPGMAERFVAEARTAARLDHPNIVGIHTVEERRGLRLLVMKLIVGLTLHDLMKRRGALPVPLALDVLTQIASALEYAHAAGVVHRDVKPANVMLDTKATAIVTDFGIAKAADSSHITMAGTLVGTPTYMSPEQFQGQRPSPALDQYALGIMAYEILTGAPPFSGSVVDLQMAHTRHPVPQPDVRHEAWTPELGAIVLRMVAKKPEDRFPSLHDARLALAAGIPGNAALVRENLAALVKDAMEQTGTRPAYVTPPRGAPVGPPIGSMLVLPTTIELTVGTTAQLEVALLDAKGAAITGRPVQWTVADPKVVSVSPNGIVSALAEGATAVQARCEDATASSSITVKPLRVGSVKVGKGSAPRA
jgi:serine/threonine-protein kinase